MSIRLAAKIMETTALSLARRGRGLFGHRERHAHQVIGGFVEEAWKVPPGGVLPHEIREDLNLRIDHAIDALETHVSRGGSQSAGRAMHDTGVVRQIYALREAQQHLMQTRHLPEFQARPIMSARNR